MNLAKRMWSEAAKPGLQSMCTQVLLVTALTFSLFAVVIYSSMTTHTHTHTHKSQFDDVASASLSQLERKMTCSVLSRQD